MVAAQYRLVTEGLGINHLRLVIGNSMGGMQTWMWGATYPDFMDALVPMAAQPTAMSSRNWMMRRMMIERSATIPTGTTATTPRSRARSASPTCSSRIATNGGTLAYQKAAPTREKADKLLERYVWPRRSTPTPTTFSTSGIPRATTIASPGLERIKAALLAINSADDERNPPETGLMEALKRVKNGKLY